MLPTFTPIPLENFRGLLSNADAPDVPPEYAPVEENAVFSSGGIDSREGTRAMDLGGGTDIFQAQWITHEDQRFYLFLMDDGLYYSNPTITGDTITAMSARTLIMSRPAGATHFQAIHYGNLVFLFFSDGDYGVTPPYVWDIENSTVDLATISPEDDILQKATGTLTASGNPSDGDTVTIGVDSFGTFGVLDLVYTFKTALTGDVGEPGEVLIGSDAEESLANLKAAINRDAAGEGSTYGKDTRPAYVLVQVTEVTATTLTLEARQSGASQDAIRTEESSGVLAWGGGTLSGGGKLDASDGEQGECNGGYHAIREVFETRTGYRSSPSEARVVLIRTDQSTLPLSGLALYTGDDDHDAAECVKRHIVMTEGFGDIRDIDNLLDPLTFISALEGTYHIALTIDDNTTTTATVSISDLQLASQPDVSDYFQFTSPLPNLSTGRIYKERLVACGDEENATLAYVSQLPHEGGPQSFRADVGFLDIRQEDGLRLVQMFLGHETLYFQKTLGLFSTQDNGGEPSEWPLQLVAEGVGTTSISGVSSISDSGFAVILDFKGLYLFDGSLPRKVSQDIQPTWETLNIPFLKNSEVHINAAQRRIYCLVPTDGEQRPDKVFVVDYEDGWNRAKWSVWFTNGDAWRSFICDGPWLLAAIEGSSVNIFDPDERTDDGTAIEYTHRNGAVAPRPFGLNLFGGIGLHATGFGVLRLKIYDIDGNLLAEPSGFCLEEAPGRDLYRQINIRTERIFVELLHNDVTTQSHVHRLFVYAKPDGIRPDSSAQCVPDETGECVGGTPTITSLDPSSATPGSGAFTLTVTGTNFIAGSVVYFNGEARETTFVSSTQLTAEILAGDVDEAGTFNVHVVNP